jgi:GT2 family glycosyltransferase
MSKNPEVSIVIINYNSKKYLNQCIESIYNQTKIVSFEILVLDNNSSDNLDYLIEENNSAIRVINNQLNLGFGVANNIGIKLTDSKYIFLLNPDTVLLNDALNIFYNFMEKKENEGVWCVGSQLSDEDGKPAKSFGSFPNLFDVVSEQIGLKGLLLKEFGENYLKKRNLSKQQHIVPFVMGCNMFIRKSDLKKIGLFNEKFFLNYEETELSWRAEKLGYKSMILPEAKILHYSGKSFSNLQSYLNHLWIGQLLFFKLTHSHLFFLLIKVVHLCGASLRFVFKLDKNYLTQVKKILSI